MSETADLAATIAGIAYKDLSSDTIHNAKRVILDQLGCQIGSARLPWCEDARTGVRALGSNGPSTVLVYGDQLTPDNAAFLNGTFGGGNEVDDVAIEARAHPGAVVIPAALSVAEACHNLQGASLLLATVLGYETMVRISLAAMPTLIEVKHHHSAVAAGPFGAGVAAASLLGLSASQTLETLAIAGTHSGGLMEHTRSGGSVKRMFTGMGASAGVRSAYFAANGITGPRSVLEGDRGFFVAFSDGVIPESLLGGLADDFAINSIAFKLYSANYRIHTALQGLEQLLKEDQIRAEDIESIDVMVSPVTKVAVGTIIEPYDALGAQFSMSFALSLVAHYGATALDSVQVKHLKDPRVRELAQRITTLADPSLEHTVGGYGMELTMKLKDGSTVTKRDLFPRGTPANPATDEDLEAKFHRLVAPILGFDATAHIVRSVWSLEATTVDDLVRYCIPEPSSGPHPSAFN